MSLLKYNTTRKIVYEIVVKIALLLIFTFSVVFVSAQDWYRMIEQVAGQTDLGSSFILYNYLCPFIFDFEVEEAYPVYMNQNYRLIKAMKLSHGNISETAVDVRIILKNAIHFNATIVAIAHNHPSNSALPSVEDDRLTLRVKKACELMCLYLLDHLIIIDG